MRRSARTPLLAAIAALVVSLAACEPPVDCDALCERTLACEVSFQPPDDPAEEKVERGERTELESCSLGCRASPLVDSESAACVHTLDVRDASVCQQDVLACLGAADE